MIFNPPLKTSSFSCSCQISPSGFFFLKFFSRCPSHWLTSFYYQVEDDGPRFAETDDGWWIDWVYWEKSSTELKFFGDPNDWIELGLTNFDWLMDQTAPKVSLPFPPPLPSLTFLLFNFLPLTMSWVLAGICLIWTLICVDLLSFGYYAVCAAYTRVLVLFLFVFKRVLLVLLLALLEHFEILSYVLGFLYLLCWCSIVGFVLYTVWCSI